MPFLPRQTRLGQEEGAQSVTWIGRSTYGSDPLSARLRRFIRGTVLDRSHAIRSTGVRCRSIPPLQACLGAIEGCVASYLGVGCLKYGGVSLSPRLKRLVGGEECTIGNSRFS